MDRLPNELIFLVGKYIEDDVFAKLALSQCSRRLQWLFDPPLAYSYLHISSIGTREFALIRHLWCRPDLACLVQHAYLGFAWCFRPDFQSITEACYPQWNWMIEHILDDICESEYEKTAWNMQLRRFCEEAWLGALLTRLNNLKSVTLAYGNNQGLINSILDKAAFHRQPFNRTTPFPLLQKVTFKSQFSWLQCNLPFAMGLFHLPAIRTIQGIKIWDSPSVGMNLGMSNFSGLKHRPSSVTEIVLSPAYNCRGMGDWISACSRLERFQVDIGIVSDTHTFYIFDPIAFRQCLHPCKKTLQVLSLRFHRSYREFRAWQRTTKVYRHFQRDDLPFGSFREFIVLEQLSMRHTNLVRLPDANIRDSRDAAPRFLVDILPTSLKSLEITDILHRYLPNLISELEVLVRLHTTIMPQFERIVLHLQEQEGELPKSLINKLERVCECMDVCLTIIRRPIQFSD